MRILIYDSGYGVVPFIRYAIANQKLHDYYLYLDAEVFPLGKKDRGFILNHLITLLKKFEQERYDLIIFACNTMASMLESVDLDQYTIRILSIYTVNKSLILDDTIFLGTKISIANLKCETIDGGELPELIEKRKLKPLIKCIKGFKINKSRVILGCTHFPLIGNIFKSIFPKVTFIDGHAILMDMVDSGDELHLSGTHKGRKLINEFFPDYSHKKIT